MLNLPIGKWDKNFYLAMKKYFIMKTVWSLLSLFFILVLCESCNKQENGPLKVSEVNPRYFTDNTGKAVYLTGSHTWDNLVDMVVEGDSKVFDYDDYLEFLKVYNHNFFRLWAWDLLTWDTRANRSRDSLVVQVFPKPWLRTGPDNALDGRPKFDLTRFNPEYFDRLRQRVEKANEADIYISVMLFDGWGLQFIPGAFENHPFHPANNINGIEMNITQDSLGLKIHELGNDKITELQELYVNKVIETVGEYDNVLYEISNENHPPSTDWQYHMINFIKSTESKLGKVHPVGMTFQYKGGKNEDLFNSPADWISPNPDGGYSKEPPVGNGKKVIINDTDHLWGIGGSRQWIWKSFLRGLNPIFMDPYKDKVLNLGKGDEWEQEMRIVMGLTKNVADEIDLINMTPSTTVASSGYCLENKGKEYLVYIPEGGETEIDLSSVNGTFNVTWIDPLFGNTWVGEPISGGNAIKLVSPIECIDAVVWIKL